MIKKRKELNLGEAYLPQHISKRLNHLSLGMPKASPFSSTDYQVLSNDAPLFCYATFIIFKVFHLSDVSASKKFVITDCSGLIDYVFYFAFSILQVFKWILLVKKWPPEHSNSS